MNTHQDQSRNSYESIEFNLSTGQTDYDLAVNQATFLTVFGPEVTSGDTHNGRYPTSVLIRTNATISVKLNSTTGQSITIASTDSPFSIVGVLLSDLFITNNSGSMAAIKLLFTDNPN
jgi:hypothetical protein